MTSARITQSLVRIGSVLLLVAAPALFLMGYWYIRLMLDFPVPGPEPVEPAPPSNDLLYLAVFCSVLVFAGLAGLWWAGKQSPKMDGSRLATKRPPHA